MKVYTDALHKIAYSTDASAYREVPREVAYPDKYADIVSLIEKAKKEHTCLIPRAGGTSIAGQVVGKGIVVDISKNWNHILEINEKERWARVESGVVRDELNIALKPYGLFFSPETSTSNRCCIGGMFGNNSCGTHSLVYGSTRHHVLACKGYLSDVSSFDTENFDGNNDLLSKIFAQLTSWATNRDIAAKIEEAYPDKSLRRRSCGYAIDEAIEVLEKDRGLALCKLLAGSEGTLAFITEIKVSLDELPSEKKMVLCAHCDTLDKSFVANLVALKHHPVAIELMDGKILELAKGNFAAQKNRFFVEGNPAAILISEFNGDDIDKDSDELEAELKKEGLAYTCTRVYGNDISRVWALRKAGLGILGGMKGDAKPAPVIEDTAVAPARMPAYMADFQEMLKRVGLSCVFYGHISTGELHLRPILNLKTEDGQKKFRTVAEEMAKLVKKHKGSLSGEHGDGRLRGEFIPLLYGEEVYQLMRDVKRCWDPDGVFNMGKIVNTPKMGESLRFEPDQHYAIEDVIGADNTYFNWRASFDECKVEEVSGVKSQTHALMCSVEQCNGAGDCRKSNLIGGTMCPAYKVSRDETKTTRARANVLREILTRGWKNEAFNTAMRGSIFKSEELKDVLGSCLACKGCKTECPSNVDMTRLRAEILQHEYDNNGAPLRSFLVARMADIEALGSHIPAIYNFLAKDKLISYLIKKIIRFSTERNIPTLSRKSMRKLVALDNLNHTATHSHNHKVYLFADEFTNYQEAELGLDFARLLMKLGYDVEIPNHKESGRAAISKGCLKLAKKIVTKNVKLLKDIITDDAPLIGIEPSCILSFRDEYPDLVPAEMRDDAKKLAKNCLLFDEFLMKEIKAGNIDATSFNKVDNTIWLHGHCHQKALVGIEKTASALIELLQAKVNIIPSGCCGMAGSFGYEKEHYKMSKAIGDMVLFPTVRNAKKDEQGCIVAAPGTSCRQQILDGTGFLAQHPIEILYQNLKS